MSAVTTPSRSTHQPGAEPIGFGSGSAEAMSIAWRRFVVRHRSECARKRSSSVAIRPGSSGQLLAEGVGQSLARQVVVRRPEAARREHDRRAGARDGECVAHDGAVVGQHPHLGQRQPIVASSRPRKAALVSTVSPSSSSAPIDSSSALVHRSRVYG